MMNQTQERERLVRDQLKKVRQAGLDRFEPAEVPDLLSVSQRVVGSGSDRERIEAALKLAIADFEKVKTREGAERTAEAARCWFGLDPETRGKDHVTRHEVAADQLGKQVRHFENVFQPEILDLTVRCLFRLKPEASVPQGAEPPEAAGAPRLRETELVRSVRTAQPRKSSRTRPATVLSSGWAQLGLAVICAAILLAALLLARSLLQSSIDASVDPSTEVPPVGTVVNAATGEIAKHVNRQPNQQGAYLSSGNDFRACNLTTESHCRYQADDPPLISDGDVLRLGIKLKNPTESPLPFITIVVSRASFGSSESGGITVYANLTVDWPGAQGPLYLPMREELKLPAASVHDRYVSMAFVPGSTVLEDADHRFLANLPDGVMEDGIALANVGSPASCFDCSDDYIRYVFFRAKVGAIRYH